MQTGLITLEDYMMITNIFVRIVNRSIVQRKADQLKERFALFKANNKQEYGRIIVRQVESNDIYKEVLLSEICAEFSISINVYIESQMFFMQTPGKAEIVSKQMRDIEKEELAVIYAAEFKANKTVLEREYMINLLKEKEENVYLTVRDLRVALEMNKISTE